MVLQPRRTAGFLPLCPRSPTPAVLFAPTAESFPGMRPFPLDPHPPSPRAGTFAAALPRAHRSKCCRASRMSVTGIFPRVLRLVFLNGAPLSSRALRPRGHLPRLRPAADRWVSRWIVRVLSGFPLFRGGILAPEGVIGARPRARNAPWTTPRPPTPVGLTRAVASMRKVSR
jgi:hypothetical protein